jgi:flagellar protein FlbD
LFTFLVNNAGEPALGERGGPGRTRAASQKGFSLMIDLRLINGTHIILNSDLIEFIEATPDTVISLSTGKKLIVKEDVDEVIRKIIQFRRRIGVVTKEFVVADVLDQDAA